jgi:predicted metal-dependent phosphoesterase TrpH
MSLHNHSNCSKETLDFVPGIARRIPLVATLFEAGLAKYLRENGRPLDFDEAFWRPPLEPAAVVESERAAIEATLGRPALVAVTDHDTIEGPRTLAADRARAVPFSFEWTVPVGGSVLHLGVHNLPPAHAAAVHRELTTYTRGQGRRPLEDLLAWIAGMPETFVIVNHPYWDLWSVGSRRHEATLLAFLRRHRAFVHALELNGYRPWSENARALPLAEGFDLPLVAAGDRHGCLPSSMFTLSPAASFSEFGAHLRAGGATTCVILPEYADPLPARILQGVRDALGEHSHRLDSRCWTDRVFVVEQGREIPVSELWPHGGPWWLRSLVWVTRALGSDSLRPVYRLAWSLEQVS